MWILDCDVIQCFFLRKPICYISTFLTSSASNLTSASKKAVSFISHGDNWGLSFQSYAILCGTKFVEFNKYIYNLRTGIWHETSRVSVFVACVSTVLVFSLHLRNTACDRRWMLEGAGACNSVSFCFRHVYELAFLLDQHTAAAGVPTACRRLHMCAGMWLQHKGINQSVARKIRRLNFTAVPADSSALWNTSIRSTELGLTGLWCCRYESNGQLSVVTCVQKGRPPVLKGDLNFKSKENYWGLLI
jgi:hypothetical protein